MKKSELLNKINDIHDSATDALRECKSLKDDLNNLVSEIDNLPTEVDEIEDDDVEPSSETD